MSKPLKPIVKQRNANIRGLLKKSKNVKVKKAPKEAIYIGNDPLTGEKLYR